MLAATQMLIRMFKSEESRSTPVALAAARFIRKHGSIEDVNPLLDLFLEDPTDFDRRHLLDPIRVHGNQETADRIYRECFEHKKLKKNMPEEILSCLGYLEYEQSQPILLNYIKENDWHLSTEACLGLVHLSCQGIEEEIYQEIQSCMGKPLFNEFVPVLSCKTKREDLIDQLYHWGSTIASVDCNAGILFGIALYGEKTRELYKKILWDERWEADGSATGTRRWAYFGMQHLQISFGELFEEIKEMVRHPYETADLRHRLFVLHALLECKIFDNHIPIKFARITSESYADIYRVLFSWSTPYQDDSIIGLVGENISDAEDKERHLSMFYAVRSLLEAKIEQELTERFIVTVC
ncbi:HEAT repeat domain-containing protein [Laceyella putida]|uniref:HEAT repeat domain-containing protein n=1 Tax=Laceyella putida TaxID=110101 RepID=A0ABW2RHQ5_9BACL